MIIHLIFGPSFHTHQMEMIIARGLILRDVGSHLRIFRESNEMQNMLCSVYVIRDHFQTQFCL